MKATVIQSMDEVDPASWDALVPPGDPLLAHAFLAAMERSGSVAPETGWDPCHIVIHDPGGGLAGAMPLYEKAHSWGEFVFDFAWAQAYDRSGLPYYPKLVSAVPFTPATGPRLLAADDREDVRDALLQAALALAETRNCSSLHLLFGNPETDRVAGAQGLHPRLDCQFHWRNEGYSSFDDFLAGFRSSRRKKLKRERRRIREAGITFRWLDGLDLTDELLDRIYPFYERTFLMRGNPPYLNRAFFEEIRETLPASLVIILAEGAGRPLAAAICLRGRNVLYGRYWGSEADYHSLHFETCFYQGIDYSIHHGLDRFEPGAQGEHKLRRGFQPTRTGSWHWIGQPAFAEAIAGYLQREREAIEAYIDDAGQQLPFRRSGSENP
jgi:predicted N-acyltransferase